MAERARTQQRLFLDTPVTYLKGVGPARAEALRRLGIVTAGDLLFWGDLNRRFRAYDSDNGKVLWESVLGGAVTTSGAQTYNDAATLGANTTLTSTGSAKWAVAAPGGADDQKKDDDIYSTFWISGQKNAYTYLAGTSMAAPHVTGALALLLAQGYNPQAAVGRLLDTADKGVGCEANSQTCRGRINVDRATAKEK